MSSSQSVFDGSEAEASTRSQTPGARRSTSSDRSSAFDAFEPQAAGVFDEPRSGMPHRARSVPDRSRHGDLFSDLGSDVSAPGRVRGLGSLPQGATRQTRLPAAPRPVKVLAEGSAGRSPDGGDIFAERSSETSRRSRPVGRSPGEDLFSDVFAAVPSPGSARSPVPVPRAAAHQGALSRSKSSVAGSRVSHPTRLLADASPSRSALRSSAGSSVFDDDPPSEPRRCRLVRLRRTARRRRMVVIDRSGV